MTFRVQGEILMDAEQAKAELRATGTAAKSTASDLRTLGTAGADIERSMGLVTRGLNSAEDSAQAMSAEMDLLRARFDPLFALSQRYEAELSELNRAHRLGALTAGQYDAALDRLNTDFARHATGAQGMATANRAVAASNRLAAGSMGNLVAQGNDVITMLVAGQNPLQLALQQGTQITQVIGPLGAAGAFRALGGAILSMLSPINLITIGAIAATAAVVNWFRSGGEEGRTFEDRLGEINDALSEYNEFADIATAETGDLIEKFGSASGLGRDLADFIAARKNAEAIGQIESALDDLTARFGGLSREELSFGVDGGGFFSNLFGNSSGGVMREIEATMARIREEFGLTTEEAGRITLALERIDSADGIENTAAAAIDLKDVLVEIFGSLGDIPGELGSLADSAARLALQAAEQATRETRRNNQEMLAFVASVTKSTEEQLRADAAAEEMLGTMTEQNAIAQAIARFGADSAEVTRLRARFARDAKLEEIEASGASEELKQELRDAALAAFDLATSDLSGPITFAANEAARLSAEVRGAVDAMFDLRSQGDFDLRTAQIRAEFKDDPIGRAGALAGARFDRDTAPIREGGFENPGEEAFLNSQRQAAVERAREIARLNEQSRPTRSRGGARRSAPDEVERERDNIDRLIATKQRELDVLREADPVQREMIRLRERLTAATPEQREAIEELTAAHHAEIEALERRDQFEQGLGDVLIQANSLKDVWQGIGDMILRAAREAVFLGTGPLSGLLGGGGGSGGGGLIGGLVSGLGGLFGFADGGLPAARLPALAGGGDARESRPGLVLGSGTARSDSILARISAGEFIMTGEATARNRPVLEAMNAGAVIPGFAGGGLPLPRAVTSAASASAASGPGGVIRLLVEPSEMFRVVATETARGVSVDVMGEGLEEFSRNTLPDRVAQINEDPRRRG